MPPPKHASISHKPYDYSWRDGEIAFLKNHSEFSEVDYKDLISSKYMDVGVTAHPVIILKRHSTNSTHALITSVSAYGSGPNNNFRPPWEQRKHNNKSREDFRAFVGSVKCNKHRHLQLEGTNQLMPKPKTSWVYVQRLYVVPITVLKEFDKHASRLCMTEESLADLRIHTSARNRGLKCILNDPKLKLEFDFNNDRAQTNLASTYQQCWGFMNDKSYAKNKSCGSETSDSTLVATATSASTSPSSISTRNGNGPQDATPMTTKLASNLASYRTNNPALPLYSKIAAGHRVQPGPPGPSGKAPRISLLVGAS
jgi:hypothetical protein